MRARSELIVRIRKDLAEQGLSAGPETIAWHLRQYHHLRVSRATISRHLTAHGTWGSPRLRCSPTARSMG
ncbi:hypothetical protein [Streptomyces sp. NPDC050287]|uniref:hypothetical protein n=1 Tax=Streptomyces sp. NPDC050287 TaxID=3365608 RepID=UPI003797B28C